MFHNNFERPQCSWRWSGTLRLKHTLRRKAIWPPGPDSMPI